MRENHSQEDDEEMGKEGGGGEGGGREGGGGEGGGGDGEAAERSPWASAHEEPLPERDTSDMQHPPLETSPTLIPPPAASTVIVAAGGGDVTLPASQLEPTPLPSDTHLETKLAPYARLESEFAQPASVSEIQVSSERLPPGMLPLHTPLIFHATSTPRHPIPPPALAGYRDISLPGGEIGEQERAGRRGGGQEEAGSGGGGVTDLSASAVATHLPPPHL
jgi:hypothetical protein